MVDPETFNTRLQNYSHQIEKLIQQNGYMIQEVFGETTQTQGFLYTIGLTEKSIPELRLNNFHPMLGNYILQTITQQVIHDHTNNKTDQRATTNTLKNHPGYDIDLGDDGQPPTRFTFTAPSAFHENGIGVAHHYYNRTVDYLDVTTQGWPCPRCVPQDPTKPCTCTFSCWWRACAMLSEYQKTVPQDDWV